MPQLREYFNLTNHSNISVFSHTNYTDSLDSEIELIAKMSDSSLYQSEQAPVISNKNSRHDLVSFFLLQGYPVETSHSDTLLLTCNPFNLSLNDKYGDLDVLLTTTRKYTLYLSQQFSNNQIEGLFQLIHLYSVQYQVSDIHLFYHQHYFTVLFRKNNFQMLQINLDYEYGKRLSNFIKLKSHIDISIVRQPQDGAYHYQYNEEYYDIRAATLPNHYGETISLRLFNTTKNHSTFTSLGFSKKDDRIIHQMLGNSHGLVLITGTTGSGKSTTLYTMLRCLIKQDKHIVTLEDPIEQVIPGVLQTAINIHQNLNFDTGLKAILRHNPDIIAIGEIRDSSTAQAALNAAYSGHLVIASLHTNNIESTLLRLYNLGCDPFLISYCLRGIISQKLIFNSDQNISLIRQILFCKSPYIIQNIKKELAKFLDHNIVLK